MYQSGRRSASNSNGGAIFAYLLLLLFAIVAVILLAILLIWSHNTKTEIKHLHNLQECEHIARRSYNTFFKHYDHDFIYNYYSNDTVICLDGPNGTNFTGYDGIHSLFYYLHRVQYHAGHDYINYGNAYAPAGKDNTCVLVLDYKCDVNITQYTPHHTWWDEMDDHDYQHHLPDHESYDDEENSPCDTCHAYVLFSLDDDWKVKTAHICANDIIHPMVSPTPIPSPSQTIII